MECYALKAAPVIFIMFGVVLLSVAILSFASYYGGDWTWIANQIAGFTLLFMVLGLAFYTLASWLRRR